MYPIAYLILVTCERYKGDSIIGLQLLNASILESCKAVRYSLLQARVLVLCKALFWFLSWKIAGQNHFAGHQPAGWARMFPALLAGVSPLYL